MPLYTFRRADGQTQDFFYSMKEVPSMGAEVEIDGVKWKRVFTTSQLATNGIKPIDPFSKKAFVEKTGAMKGNLGNLWDTARELSEKRAEKDGVDPVKESYYRDYKKARRGTSHMAQLKEKNNEAIKKANEKLEKHGISIGLT